MAKIGVVLCITELEVGGAERCLVELATRMDRQRFDPAVCVLSPPPKRDGSLRERLDSCGIETHYLGGRSWRDLPSVYWRLRALLAKRRPAVAQSFLFHANLLTRLASRAAKVPHVLSGVRVAQRRGRWRLWLDRRTDRLVDRHVCVSHSVARFCQEQVGLPAEKLVVISNGIDPARYRAVPPADLAPSGIPPERRVITFIGRLEPQKGVQWLLQTAAEWLGPLPGVELVLVGHGPQRRELEQLARRLGIEPRVHLLGYRTDAPEILARSTLLVLPSAWEGMPNVLLEAMASGLPVVATDVEGVGELLGPAAEPQTVAYGDSQALVLKVLRLMGDANLAEQLGRQNRLRATSQFTIERMFRAYESLWESLATGAAKF